MTASRLALDPLRAAAEMAEFSQRMALATAELAKLDVRTEGCTPRTEAMRRGKTVLWRYAREAPEAGLAPLVICYALVNRPYMLDLQPDRSLIRGLARAAASTCTSSTGAIPIAATATSRSTTT